MVYSVFQLSFQPKLIFNGSGFQNFSDVIFVSINLSLRGGVAGTLEFWNRGANVHIYGQKV